MGARRIAVIGLGYVGLPVAVAFARRFPGTVGFDTDRDKVERLRRGEDPTGAVPPRELAAARVTWSAEVGSLVHADFYVIAVPTPIDEARKPDLSALRDAASTIGKVLSKGDVVVLESTVYPGVTEDVLGPILAGVSGLRSGVDFTLGYSPERINPGDPEHDLASVRKIVAAQDAATLETLIEGYGAVVSAGLHVAPSIRVAEAAKVIENVQRDLNVALVNELAMLFDRLDLDTRAVLEAAGSKWNFHAYQPGLVGGHCIGVDPYYLTSKASSVGFQPRVMLAGRRTNEGMGDFLAGKTLELLSAPSRALPEVRIAVLGIAFKPNVRDPRSSLVPDVVRTLEAAGARVLVHDPLVDAAEVASEYDIELVPRSALTALDAVVLAVPHDVLVPTAVELMHAPTPLLVDVMWAVEPSQLPDAARYWRP